MPVMTGTEAARIMRALGYRGTIFGMTGDPKGTGDRMAFERSGPDCVADKDSNGMGLLEATIMRVLDSERRPRRGT